jgi:molybdate transport system ATP-binding protein
VIRVQLARPAGPFPLKLAFDCPAHGVTAVFGPSAAGKTTLLRCLAGLEPGVRGRVEVDGALWQDDAQGRFVAPHRRGVGYVFQEASLFAHRSVRGNLRYGFERTPPAQRRIGWEQAVELLDLDSLLERRIGGLSGGERQRVAIARALLASPRLLLLDEPLAGLDAARRREILPVLQRLHQRLALPVLYVSHHIDEVIQLADHLVLLAGGAVVASGPLAPTLARLDLPLAQDEDASVVVHATVAAHDAHYHLSELHFPGGRLLVPDAARAPGESLRLRICARDVSIALGEAPASSILNRLPVRVEQIGAASHPANVLVRLDAGGTALLARLTRRSCEELALRPGQAVWAQVKSVALMG